MRESESEREREVRVSVREGVVNESDLRRRPAPTASSALTHHHPSDIHSQPASQSVALFALAVVVVLLGCD